ncbi:hypothetical protein JOM56_000762 [Amanita muscaria]
MKLIFVATLGLALVKTNFVLSAFSQNDQSALKYACTPDHQGCGSHWECCSRNCGQYDECWRCILIGEDCRETVQCCGETICNPRTKKCDASCLSDGKECTASPQCCSTYCNSKGMCSKLGLRL